MRIAVTGGAGFIGSAAVNWANFHGHEAWSFDRQSGHDIMGNLHSLRGADAVLHCAGVLGTAELFENVEQAIQVNIVGTARILEWCRQHNASFVGITMPPVFPSVYTATKICTSHLGKAYHNAYGTVVSWVKAFNAYGPRQHFGPGHPQKIVPTFSVKAWRGEPIPIWGDGEQAVDLVHAEDCGKMMVDAAVLGRNGQSYDAGTGVALTVNQVAEFVLKITGSKAGVEHLPMRPGEEPTHIVAEGEGWDLLGWKPEFDWDRLASTIRAYRVLA